MIERQIGVGQRLRLNPLGCVNDKDGAFAGRQTARHLIGKINVTGGINQIQVIFSAVLSLIA